MAVAAVVFAVLVGMGVTSTAALAEGGSESTKTYTATTDEGINVTVSAPDDAFDRDVTLQASVVGEQDSDAVASELDNAGVSYDGFMALDVHFADADGNEVEPNGNVDVKFELPQAALGDDVDASTLAVQHLAEDENGDVTKVDAVADAGDATQGTVETTDDKATADFSVDSFSKFTITWWSGDNQDASRILV